MVPVKWIPRSHRRLTERTLAAMFRPFMDQVGRLRLSNGSGDTSVREFRALALLLFWQGFLGPRLACERVGVDMFESLGDRLCGFSMA